MTELYQFGTLDYIRSLKLIFEEMTGHKIMHRNWCEDGVLWMCFYTGVYSEKDKCNIQINVSSNNEEKFYAKYTDDNIGKKGDLFHFKNQDQIISFKLLKELAFMINQNYKGYNLVDIVNRTGTSLYYPKNKFNEKPEWYDKPECMRGSMNENK